MKTQCKNSVRIMMILFVMSFLTACFAQETEDKKYWSEVVTSQPEGFVIGEDGNVTISDAESFAWMISVANCLNGVEKNYLKDKTIFITNDLDMSAYKWMPLKPFNVTIKGEDIKIDGLPVKDLFDRNNFGEFTFHIEGIVFDFNKWSIQFPGK
ncbi:MAG: hypothetical protein IJZ06_04970 [Bacteroidales bacterium]|nr:hypothetical protein [Bacteroidales bacterium]